MIRPGERALDLANDFEQKVGRKPQHLVIDVNERESLESLRAKPDPKPFRHCWWIIPCVIIAVCLIGWSVVHFASEPKKPKRNMGSKLAAVVGLRDSESGEVAPATTCGRTALLTGVAAAVGAAAVLGYQKLTGSGLSKNEVGEMMDEKIKHKAERSTALFGLSFGSISLAINAVFIWAVGWFWYKIRKSGLMTDGNKVKDFLDPQKRPALLQKYVAEAVENAKLQARNKGFGTAIDLAEFIGRDSPLPADAEVKPTPITAAATRTEIQTKVAKLLGEFKTRSYTGLSLLLDDKYFTAWARWAIRSFRVNGVTGIAPTRYHLVAHAIASEYTKYMTSGYFTGISGYNDVWAEEAVGNYTTLTLRLLAQSTTRP